MSLSAPTVAHGKVAAEMAASIAAADLGPLTEVQTTHGMDLVIASLTHGASRRKLRSRMHGSGNSIMRVNAAGILARTPDQDIAEHVAAVLENDPDTRRLYPIAVIARVRAIPWPAATKIATGAVRLTPKQAPFLASCSTAEVLNPRDAGARWCSAAMLRNLSPLLGPESA